MAHRHGRCTGQGMAVGDIQMNRGQKQISTLAVTAVVTTTLLSSMAQAQIRYVDDDAPLLGDGLTWNTAYALQARQQGPGGASVT